MCFPSEVLYLYFEQKKVLSPEQHNNRNFITEPGNSTDYKSLYVGYNLSPNSAAHDSKVMINAPDSFGVRNLSQNVRVKLFRYGPRII